MEIQAFMEKYQIGILAKATPAQTETVRGETADAVIGLYMQLVMQQDYQTLKEYLSGQTLLPRMWGQGDAKCILFPDYDGNVIGIFFVFTGDAVSLMDRSKQLMNRYLEDD